RAERIATTESRRQVGWLIAGESLPDSAPGNPIEGVASHPHILGSAGHSAAHGLARPWWRAPACRSSGGYAMRTFDLSPLYRSTVGFDRLFSMLDGFESAPGYPPYNIERTGENDYRITVAVAGFGENDLSIEAKENTLTIKGAKQ